MASFLLLSLLSLLSLMGLSTQTEPYLRLSSPSATYQVGSPISLRCEIVGVSPDDDFTLFFLRDGEDIYQISSTLSNDDSTWSTAGKTVLHQIDLQELKHTSTVFPFYDVSFKQTSLGAHDFSCRLATRLQTTLTNLRLNSVPLKITSTEAPPVFSTNLTSGGGVVLGKPFTATCTFSSGTPAPLGPYTVVFYNSYAGRLVSFEVADGQTIVNQETDESIDSIDVTPGSRETYPIFDLVLTEKKRTNLTYWCTREERGGEKVVKSNVWSAGVSFSASKSGSSTRVGTCAVGGAAVSVRERATSYSVQFVSDLGPKAENVLAEYGVKAGHPEVFLKHSVGPWSNLHHGPNTTWPTFSLEAAISSSRHLNATWWCVLSLGTSRSADYRQLKSAKVAL